MLGKFFSKKRSPLKTQHLDLGQKGEKIACVFLQNKGYTILAQNWRSHPCEIDIICEHQGTIIFVEVKTRSSHNLDHALHAFHSDKQNHIVKAAKKYLSETNKWDQPCRFDLICIINTDKAQSTEKKVEHFENVIEHQGNTHKGNSAHSGNPTWQPW